MSGDRRDDDAGAIAWPGFVDILSSVMIMFLFFMLITSIVMFGMNIEYRKKVKKETEEKFSALVSEELRDKLKELLSGGETVEEILKKLENQNQLEKLQVENTDLSKEVTELQKVVEQVKKDVSTGASQNTKVGDDDSLLIIYDNNDVTLSEQTTKVIEAYIEGIKKKNEGKRLTIRVLSSDNPNAASISLSREISLSRSLNVRNVLMKSAIDTKDIDISYSKPLSIDDTFNWLKILVEVEDDP
ncbi:MAG: hypothetical protein KDI90_07285 [Alphaproteobacteria bacterium]|nr:hypothetical protein [Alphaproteobacteria bacterium]MCB9974531.1 hypothetical protein [Rhodospirillales bacterium]